MIINKRIQDIGQVNDIRARARAHILSIYIGGEGLSGDSRVKNVPSESI